MSAAGILNSDLSTIGQMIRQGFVWWGEELAGLLPERWRADGGGGVVVQADPRGGYRFLREGRTIRNIEAPLTRRQSVTLLAPEGAVLIRAVDLPILSTEDTRRLVAMEIDRLMPFVPGQAIHDLRLAASNSGAARRQVTIGAIPTAAAVSIVERARAFGLEPRRLGVISEGEVLFDFMRPLRASSGAASGGRTALWWAAVAGLFALNLFLLVFKDMNTVAALRETVDAQREAASVALRIRNMADAERTARVDQLARRQSASPLGLLETLAEAMPRDAWIHRLAWNGRAARMTGFKKQGGDLAGVLQKHPALRNTRSLAAPISQAATAGREPFDVAIEVARPR